MTDQNLSPDAMDLGLSIRRTMELFKEGTLALVEGDPKTAIDRFLLAISLNDGKDFRCQYNLIVAKIMDGDRHESLRLAIALRKQNPTHFRAYIICGQVYLLQKKHDDALKHFKAASYLNPSSATAIFFGELARARIHGYASYRFQISINELVKEKNSDFYKHRIDNQISAFPLTEEVAGISDELCSDTWLMDYYAEYWSNDNTKRVEAKPSPKSLPEQINVDSAADKIGKAKNIVAITGAGFSAASHLKTRKELWEEFNRDDAVSIWRFKESPEILWNVIRNFLGPCDQMPNEAHRALAQMQNVKTILTQNVDGLHQDASATCPSPSPENQKVMELHGSLHRTYCVDCSRAGPSCYDVVRHNESTPPVCECGGIFRPDVVLFGESIKKTTLDVAIDAVSQCDLLLVMGCAMDVSPVSELPNVAVSKGIEVIEIKRTNSELANRIGGNFLQGKVEVLLPDLLNGLKEKQNEQDD